MTIKQCECGSKSFSAISECRVFFELDDNGILKPVEEESLGLDCIFTCDKCNKEYEPYNFKEIL